MEKLGVKFHGGTAVIYLFYMIIRILYDRIRIPSLTCQPQKSKLSLAIALVEPSRFQSSFHHDLEQMLHQYARINSKAILGTNETPPHHYQQSYFFVSIFQQTLIFEFLNFGYVVINLSSLSICYSQSLYLYLFGPLYVCVRKKISRSKLLSYYYSIHQSFYFSTMQPIHVFPTSTGTEVNSKYRTESAHQRFTTSIHIPSFLNSILFFFFKKKTYFSSYHHHMYIDVFKTKK